EVGAGVIAEGDQYRGRAHARDGVRSRIEPPWPIAAVRPPCRHTTLGRGGDQVHARSAKLEALPLCCRSYGEGGVYIREGGADRSVERRIVSSRIVMKRHQVRDATEAGQGQRMMDRAVSPADVPWIFFAGVLRVVQEEVDASDQIEPGRPLGIQRKL